MATTLPTRYSPYSANGAGFPGGSFSLTPGTSPGATTFASSGGYGGLTDAGCGFLPSAQAKALCLAAAGVVGGLFGRGGGSGGGTSGAMLNAPQACPPGHVPTGNPAMPCRLAGPSAWLPGDVGRPDYVWGAVNGRYGAGVVPAPIPRTRLQCPAGYVLGKDDVCYDRLRKSDRKHNPGTKPFMTGGEVATVRKANRLRAKFRRLSGGRKPLFPQPKKCTPKRRKR